MFQTRPVRWGAVLWLGMHGAVAAAALGAFGGLRAPWPVPADLLAAHAAAALFFLVFVWPLLLPAALRAAPAGRTGPGRAIASPLLLFAALGAPFLLLGARVAGTGMGTLLRSAVVVAAVALCVASAFAGRRGTGPRVPVLYQAAAWTVCAGAPFLYYLVREWAGADWGWLAALSPFRGAVDPAAGTGWGPLWAVQGAGYAALAAVLAGSALRRARGERGRAGGG
jgi:hypothetical protein